MVVQLRAAVGTIGQPGEQPHFSHLGWTAAVFPAFLHNLPCLLVDNRFMGALKPCVDNRDAARKQKNKITYFKQKRNIETGKEIKKLVFSK